MSIMNIYGVTRGLGPMKVHQTAPLTQTKPIMLYIFKDPCHSGVLVTILPHPNPLYAERIIIHWFKNKSVRIM